MIKDYSNQLPRELHEYAGICQMLDLDGNLCTNRADFEISYHGDSEISSSSWAAIKVCKSCCIKYDLTYEEYSGN